MLRYKLCAKLFYKSMRAIDPMDMASLDPKGLIGRIYVGDHKDIASYYIRGVIRKFAENGCHFYII